MHPTSKVFGIVWDTDANFARVFSNRTDARRERSRMIRFDNRGRYKVKTISAEALNKLREKLGSKQ